MNERVLSGKFKKVYSKDDVKNWVKFGFDMKLIYPIFLIEGKNRKQLIKQKTTFTLFRNEYE